MFYWKIIVILALQIILFADEPFSFHKENKVKCEGNIIQTKGYSDTTKGNYYAKKRALMDAYRNAISQGSGVNVESFTQVEITDALSKVYSVMNSKSKGFISSYKLVDANEKASNRFEVIIDACVLDKEGTSKSYENGLNMFVKLIGIPSVLIVIEEEEYSKALKNKKLDSLSVNTIESAMSRYFKSIGYKVILSDDIVGRNISDKKKIADARKGVGGVAVQLARDVGVDVVITGKVVYNLEKTQISDIVAEFVTTSFNVKALMPGSGKTVGIYNEQDKVIDVMSDTHLAKEKSLKNIALKASKKLVWDIPKYLINEEREIEIGFNNISYRDFKKIKTLLQNKKEILGVEENGRWKKGKTRLVVQTSFLGVTSDDIIEMLETAKYYADVIEVTKYFVSFDFAKK